MPMLVPCKTMQLTSCRTHRSCTYYTQGMLGITLVNLIPALRPIRGGVPPPPAGINATRSAFWAFMYLTALGAGGIKPCVSSFGGDQFNETSVRERCA